MPSLCVSLCSLWRFYFGIRVYAAAAALTVALVGLLNTLSPPALVALVYTR